MSLLLNSQHHVTTPNQSLSPSPFKESSIVMPEISRNVSSEYSLLEGDGVAFLEKRVRKRFKNVTVDYHIHTKSFDKVGDDDLDEKI